MSFLSYGYIRVNVEEKDDYSLKPNVSLLLPIALLRLQAYLSILLTVDKWTTLTFGGTARMINWWKENWRLDTGQAE